MKKNIFMPLFKKFKNKRFFIAQFNLFIKEFVNALMGFFIGLAVEAIFNLEFGKALICFVAYFIMAFLQSEIKNNKQLKNNRGICKKSLKKLLIYIILEGGIICLMILIGVPALSIITCCIWTTLSMLNNYKRQILYLVIKANHKSLNKNLIYQTYNSKSLNL